MFADIHTHLAAFSGDGHQTVEELLQAAKEQQLVAVCITDHYDKDVFYKPDREEIFSLENYFRLLQPLRQARMDKQPRLLIGIELGYLPHLPDHFTRLTRQWPFDSVILSLHLLDGRDPFIDEEIYQVGKIPLYTRYLEQLADMVKEVPDHDIVGHFDYICRYAPYQDRKMYYRELPEAFDHCFQVLIEKDKGLEINSGTIAKLQSVGYQGFEAWPDPDIIRAYHRLGGRRICLGSDAHYSKQIGRYFAEGADWLRKLGFSELTYYQNRQPVMLQSAI